MIRKTHEFPTEHIIVDAFYDADEMEAIWQELEFLHGSLRPPEQTHAARLDGELLKQSHGVFLDQVYRDRSTSHILKLNRKLWSAIAPFARTSSFSQIHTATMDWTLISYYEDTDYYKGHADESLLTALTWFYREPKSYSGGDLFFSDFDDYKIEARHNRLLVFPGWVRHEVEPIRMQPGAGARRGRYVMAQLLNYSHKHEAS